MYSHHHLRPDDTDDKIAQRQTSGLIGIAIVLLLLVGGLFLIKRLHNAAVIEDCLLAGRRFCAVAS